MFEVYWTNWEGREVEPDEICNTLEEAHDYIDRNSDNCAPDEGYIIFDKLENCWRY